MKVAVAFPLPLDQWDTFRPDVIRFCDTWRKFPPGTDCTLIVLPCRADPDSEVKALFDGLPAEYLRYDGAGCDIGAHQEAAKHFDGFIVGSSTRVFFHRAGWLNHMVYFRKNWEPGLYGTAYSEETGKGHIRTQFYGLDSFLWREYPDLIDTRKKTLAFEHGANDRVMPIWDWIASQRRFAGIVTWDWVRNPSDWSDENGYRRGNQESLLVFDRHSQLWADSSPEEKERLTKMAYG